MTVCITEKQRIRAVLLRTRFTTLRRSEIHLTLKIDADALNRRRRRFGVRRKIYHIYQGPDAVCCKCACVYGIYSVKNKIENETNVTDCTFNLT
jgi:hypothetical protein